jgi:ubiquinone/menaquinone biosynthesis C-methylase UbiE
MPPMAFSVPRIKIDPLHSRCQKGHISWWENDPYRYDLFSLILTFLQYHDVIVESLKRPFLWLSDFHQPDIFKVLRMDVKYQQTRIYDKWADHYDRSLWVAWIDSWVDRFLAEIPLHSSILDIGCGTGNVLLRLSEKRPALLAGIDISPGMVAVAKKKLTALPTDLRNGDAESGLPWSNGFFDVVVMTATFHHFPNPDKVLSHVFRVLRSNGMLIVADPLFPFPFLSLVNVFLKIYPRNGDLCFYSKHGLWMLLEKCGFDRIHHNSAGFLAQYTLAHKPKQ